MSQATLTRESDGACLAVCRPAWTQPGWFYADLDPRVRALLDLPLGVELITARQGLGPVGSRCPQPHEQQWADGDPVGVPGNPCACQIVVAAAWSAMSSWTTQAEGAYRAGPGGSPRQHLHLDQPDRDHVQGPHGTTAARSAAPGLVTRSGPWAVESALSG